MLSRFFGALLLFYAAASTADEPASSDRLTFLFSPYVYHLHYDPAHSDEPWFTGLEWEPQGSKYGLDYGATYFRNSFDQPSVYVYVGRRWFPYDSENRQGLFLNITGGPLYGYRGQYEDKVPLNYHGLAWAIIPGVGYHYRSVEAQLVFLGAAALMFTVGYDFVR